MVPKTIEPQDEHVRESPHVSPMASPTHSQGENEEHNEPKSRSPVIKEIPSSSKSKKPKSRRGNTSAPKKK